jgi:hypothetical protein
MGAWIHFIVVSEVKDMKSDVLQTLGAFLIKNSFKLYL